MNPTASVFAFTQPLHSAPSTDQWTQAIGQIQLPLIRLPSANGVTAITVSEATSVAGVYVEWNNNNQPTTLRIQWLSDSSTPFVITATNGTIGHPVHMGNMWTISGTGTDALTVSAVMPTAANAATTLAIFIVPDARRVLTQVVSGGAPTHVFFGQTMPSKFPWPPLPASAASATLAALATSPTLELGPSPSPSRLDTMTPGMIAVITIACIIGVGIILGFVAAWRLRTRTEWWQRWQTRQRPPRPPRPPRTQ
jgi:hypothetical protein